jgi:hypothetical protein
VALWGWRVGKEVISREGGGGGGRWRGEREKTLHSFCKEINLHPLSFTLFSFKGYDEYQVIIEGLSIG